MGADQARRAAGGGKVIPFRRPEPAASTLDVYVKPSELPTAPAMSLQTLAWPAFDDNVTHPGYGLEPRTLNTILRGAEQGLLWRQADLFDDIIESDGHLRSLIESRRDAVSSKDWVIQPGAPDAASLDAADRLSRQLRDSLNFHRFLEHQLSAPYYGYAASEIEWGWSGDFGFLPVSFRNVPHRRFMLGSGNQLELIVSNTRTEPLRAGQWAVSQRPHHNLARAGLMRTATWWALFKRMSVRDWVVFAERFGIPFAIGVYEDRAGEEAKRALEEALSQLGNAGQVVISEATKIVMSDVAQRNGNTTVHEGLIALCEAQMSKLINGATQNVETGSAGSYAQARVHETRAYLLSRADANALAAMFTQDISRPFIRFNGYPETTAPPRLKVQVFQEMDPLTRSHVASRLANELGGSIDRGQLYDDLGFRLPASEADALHGTKSSGASGDGDEDGREEPT